jgi:hypothetical protein
MIKKMVGVLALTLATQSYAGKWICSVDIPDYSPVDSEFKSASGNNAQTTKKVGANAVVKSKFKIDQIDVMQLYTGTPVIIGSTWLKGFVLPSNLDVSQTSFLNIGMSPNTGVVAEKLARASSYNDKGLRYVSTEHEVIMGVAARTPSVGYVNMFVGGFPGVKECFSD